jgi:hypothetical protein
MEMEQERKRARRWNERAIDRLSLFSTVKTFRNTKNKINEWFKNDRI